MATTRELSEAYAYANRRLSTALLRGADEARLDPRRRLNRALGGGVAVGVLILAGFGIAGYLGGGSGPDLPRDGAVMADGQPYVVRDGVVHPALNLASAMLAGGGQPTTVRQETLDDAPRGLPVGIPEAPSALPDADDLVDEDWTLCATPSETGGDPADTALYVGVPGVAPHGPGATLLAEAEDGRLWLLAEGRRHALEPDVARQLDLADAAVPLPRRFVATVPEGPEITIPPPGDGAGSAPRVELAFDAAVNDVAHTPAGGPTQRYFVVRPDGLLEVSELVYVLLTAHAGEVHEISHAEAERSSVSAEAAPGDPGWPQALPRPAVPERNQPVCVSTPPGSPPGDAPWRATVHLPARMPEPEGVEPVVAQGNERLGLLNRVYVPAGSGVLVRDTPSAATGGTYTLVTDTGFAYPFASREPVGVLGYEADEAPAMPSAYVGLLPRGPVLDPEAAVVEQRGTDTSADNDDGDAGRNDGGEDE